jgi:saccharopine dehydrogenase-like NADP-dependent oxidoreductase
MLAAAAVAELDTVESIEVLDACVAGRPYDPDEPYVPAYAADTLIDEFTRPAPMFIDGREQLMPAGGGARTYHLPEGDVECVYTIHSEPATLPRSYAERGIRSVEWRLGLPAADTLPLRALVASGWPRPSPCA